MRRDVVSETITPTQPCLVHGIKYPKTEKMAGAVCCAAGEKKISISSKTYLLFVLKMLSPKGKTLALVQREAFKTSASQKVE